MFSIVEKEWLQEGKKQAWKNTKAEAIRWVVNINNKLDTWIFVGVTHISAPHQPKIFFLSEDILKFLTHPLVQDPKLHFNVTFMSLPTSFSSTSSPLPSVTSDVIHYIFKLQLSCAPSSTLTLYSWMMKSLMLSVMTNSAIFHGCPSVLPKNQTIKYNCIYSVCKTHYTFKLNTVLNCHNLWILKQDHCILPSPVCDTQNSFCMPALNLCVPRHKVLMARLQQPAEWTQRKGTPAHIRSRCTGLS